MKLNITDKISHMIDERLGISEARKDELFTFIERKYNEVRQEAIGVRLVNHYGDVANFCNNIEEYTLCMHCLIFNLANIGTPVDSKKVTN